MICASPLRDQRVQIRCSIRHALVSFRLPKLPAGGKVTVDWLNEKPADPPAFNWAGDR